MNKKPATFVTKVDVSLADKLHHDLLEQGFTFSQPAYTLFSAKKKGVACTLYKSGKMVVQGKDKEEFIEFYLEPHVLQSFEYTHTQEAVINLSAHSGVDESGKGDFFGPLCVAGVFAAEGSQTKLVKLGVRDSKLIKDVEVMEISTKIRRAFTHHIVRINPLKYNELYAKFRNLNTMLAWGHATVIQNLVEQSSCDHVIIDQFADERVVINALKKKNMDINLTQRHRGEEDIVVAAASILARAGFLEGLYKLRKTYDLELPKGASKGVVAAGKKFVQRYGSEALKEVGKMHFKTSQVILTGY